MVAVFPPLLTRSLGSPTSLIARISLRNQRRVPKVGAYSVTHGFIVSRSPGPAARFFRATPPPTLPPGLPWRSHSTASAADASDEDHASDEDYVSPPTSLRAAVRPFVKLIHPDRYGKNLVARKTNMVALQTLNSMMDGLEPVGKGGGRAEAKLGRRYQIEFVVPTGDSKFLEAVTRRSIVLRFDGRPTFEDGITEISRLLQVAGLEAPAGAGDRDRKIRWSEDLLGTTGASTGASDFRSGEPMDERERERRRRERLRDFGLDWREEEAKHTRALAAMRRDLETLGMTDEEMKREVVADLLGSRLKFLGEFGRVEQFVTVRRLSLILEDYFDFLRMEDHGKIWGSVALVIYNDAADLLSASVGFGAKKLRHESGFKFSWDENGKQTVYIPHDFKDWQFLDEFNQNIGDFNIMDEKYVR